MLQSLGDDLFWVSDERLRSMGSVWKFEGGKQSGNNPTGIHDMNYVLNENN